MKSIWDKFLEETTTVVSRSRPKQLPVVLQLYRGFSGRLDTLPRTADGRYVLTPANGDQQRLWFTHSLITVYDPLEYAADKGKHLLIYPLECTRHVQLLRLSNGSVREDTPRAIVRRANIYEDCEVYRGYELPPGWYFSYKMEKFICTSNELHVSGDMIKPSRSVLKERRRRR